MLKLVSFHIQEHLNAFLQILEYFSQICLGPLARESPCTTRCRHSLVLLRMGEIIARNMLSWLKLLIKLLLLHIVGCLCYGVNWLYLFIITNKWEINIITVYIARIYHVYSHMFRHCQVIIRQFYICASLSCTSFPNCGCWYDFIKSSCFTSHQVTLSSWIMAVEYKIL